MRDRLLIVAWVALFALLASAGLYAEFAYDGGRAAGAAMPGDAADGTKVEVDPNATGSPTGAALTGAERQGGGPPGRAVSQVQLPTPEAGRPARPGDPALRDGGETPPARIAFAAAQPPADGRPRIALIMSEIGLGRARSRQAIDRLPPGITVAVMAYAEDRESWVTAARAAGHEVLLAMPMEPFDYPRVDPGPEPLLVDLDDTENLARYDRALRDAGGVVGVLAHMGARFLATEARLRPVLAATQDRGLIFVDARSGPDSAVEKLAGTLGLHVVLNDRFVDAEPSRDAIDRRLGELEAIALRRGYAAGVATPYPVAIEQIRKWAAGLGERGLTLAPTTAIAGLPPL